jgi:hypothetical protein
MNTSFDTQLPVAVLGAGPVGLAAAAHLVARGFTPLVLESGAEVASNLQGYRHVRLFSPWQYNVDKAARRLLEDAGWQAPNGETLPMAGELVDAYLKPLAALPAIAPHLRLAHRVVAITRAGFDKVRTRGREESPFVIRAATPEGEREYLARAVIDATGTWSQPNPLGANGLPALGEAELRERIFYGMPDVLGALRQRYAGRRVLVAGAGHSAAGSLLALATLAEQEPGTRIVWVIRGRQSPKLFGGGEADGLAARGLLGMRLKALQQSGRLELHEGFRIRALADSGSGIAVHADAGAAVIEGIDEIIAATGARPNLAITRELRVRHDPWLESTDLLAPLIDPNEHSCGTVRPHGHRELAHPEAGYYAVGAKSYGRAPNFLMATGYEQVRSVVAALAGDTAAADAVQLELPETGVCSTRQADDSAPVASGCCGGPAPAPAQGCCAADVKAKGERKGGCGCPSAAAPAASPACCA